MNPSQIFAQTSRKIINVTGAGTLGGGLDRTTLLGGGITVAPTDLLEFFGEATLEVGHRYPADTQEPPSQTSDVGAPVAVIIVNTPLVGFRSRVNAVYFGGVRVITPPERTVRAFVDVGFGLAQLKGTTTSYPANLPIGYYTERQSIWGVGGGLSKVVRDTWVLNGEYRWCHPWSTNWVQPFHRVQVGLGLQF